MTKRTTLQKVLKNERVKRQLTKQTLADAINEPVAKIISIENIEIADLDNDTLEKIAMQYGMDGMDLVHMGLGEEMVA